MLSSSHSYPLTLAFQVHDSSDLSCSNGGNASVSIIHTPGTMPDGDGYNFYVRQVNVSDGGVFEHIITDLVPGQVSALFHDFVFAVIFPDEEILMVIA